MKKIIVLLLACGVFQYGFAQRYNRDTSSSYGEIKGGFKQENIFVGGSLNLGLGGGQLTLGASPEIGYSFTKWFDAGLGLNLIYTSVAANTYYNPSNTKLRQFNYGGGPFVRLYPVNFLFVQGQFEENWTKIKVKQDIYTYKTTVNAASFIAGLGYTQRQIGQGSYYIFVGVDLLKNAHSPYVTENEVGQIVAQPIVRVGYNVYLHPAKQQTRREANYQSARIL